MVCIVTKKGCSLETLLVVVIFLTSLSETIQEETESIQFCEFLSSVYCSSSRTVYTERTVQQPQSAPRLKKKRARFVPEEHLIVAAPKNLRILHSLEVQVRTVWHLPSCTLVSKHARVQAQSGQHLPTRSTRLKPDSWAPPGRTLEETQVRGGHRPRRGER